MLAALDLVQSSFFAGAVLLLLLAINGSAADSYSEQTSGVIVQQNAINVGSIMTNDLMKMGYMVPAGTPVVTNADTLGNITFKAEINASTAWVDSIKYQVVKPTGARFFRVQRTVNTGLPTKLNVNIDSMVVNYYKSSGEHIPASMLQTQAGRDSIRCIKVRMHYADTFSSLAEATSNTWQASYKPSTIVWERTVTPRNIQNSR